MAHLLLELFIFFAAASFAVPLAKRYGLSSVLGYLLAGVLIGPFGLSLIRDVDAVMHLTELGVVMMLFLIGLELKPSLLWELRRSVLGMGGAQVGGTALIIAVIGATFLPWKTALALGLILSLSSTAIVLQTLREKGLDHTAAGRAVFSILLFQDLAVLPMFAILPLLSVLPGRGEAEAAHGALFDISALSTGWRVLAVLAAIATVFLVARYLAKPIFRIVADTGVREIFIAVVLALVLGISLLMSLVGLSPALGVFLAGVVLADNEYRFELESDLDPFKGLLLGGFFIAIGASLDFNYIWQHLSAVLGFVALLLFVKWLVLQLVGLAFSTPKASRSFLAAALAEGGEFAFVLFQFSRSNGVLDASTVTLCVSVVALSMFLAPLLFIAEERLAQPPPMPTRGPDDKIDRSGAQVILVGFGQLGSDLARILLSAGVRPIVIEHDAETVATLREFGFEVYYGDACRLELLEAAGAAKAELLVMTGREVERTELLVSLARQHFPKLKLAAVAKDRPATYQLMELGLGSVRRETFGSALMLGQDVLQSLGFRPFEALRLARLFRHQDEAWLPKLSKVSRQRGQRMYSALFKRQSDRIQAVMESVKGDNLDIIKHAWRSDVFHPKTPEGGQELWKSICSKPLCFSPRPRSRCRWPRRSAWGWSRAT